MPRTRTKAQVDSERKYDREKRQPKGLYWCIVAYPDSVPDNWIDILKDTHVQILISPLHKDDIDANDEEKKAHWHIFLMFDSTKSFSQVKEISDVLNAPAPHREDSRRGTARYLCHLDDPSKAQYDPNDVIELNGADYFIEIESRSDRYQMICEMMDFVDSKNVVTYWELCKYARENNDNWFRALCDNSGWTMKEYIKSHYWGICSNKGGDFDE